MGRTKHIYIAYTGGTIGMRRSDAGWQPAPGFLAEAMAGMPDLQAEGMPTYEIHEFDSLLDSSNMTPPGWIKIARRIDDNYFDGYDAFIVLHGTDTMAYTASALSMFLAGLDKPVIMTGSQIPLCQPRNDARENLVTALQIAGDDQAPKEVCVYFNDLLLRGCRTTKMDCDGFGAFGSPNVQPLGKIGVYFEYRVAFNRHLFRKHSSAGPDVPPGAAITASAVTEPARVGTLRLYPGISMDVLRAALAPPVQGLVLECFGVGNGPDHDREFIETLTEASERVAVVDVTQCPSGSVYLGDYATGAAMKAAGVIPGADLTCEAALAKLFYLFQLGLSLEQVKTIMPLDIRGELTGPAFVPPQGDTELQRVVGRVRTPQPKT
jgi:L-asparaginase